MHRPLQSLVALLCALCLAACLALQGCRKSSAQSQGALTEVRLGYFPNITHAQAVLAVDSGDFQTALGSIKLKPKTFKAGPDLIQALTAGEIDIAYVGPGPALNAYVASHGDAVRVISGAAANGVVIVAGKDSGIQSMQDLVGKKIATPQLYNTQDISARRYMTEILGQPNANNVIPVANSEQSAMMSRGNIDAAWVPEPWGARLIAETGAHLVAEEKDLWPNHEFALTVIITTPKFLADHPDIVEKILAVHSQWTRRLTQNPETYSDQLNTALTKITHKDLPPEVVRESLQHTLFTNDPLPETFKTMGQWSANLKILKSAPDLSGLFDTAIIEKLAKP